MPLLQTLIVDQAAEAPNLASTLNQGAFNLGNAGGAWLGSMALGSGLPLTGSPDVRRHRGGGAAADAVGTCRHGRRAVTLAGQAGGEALPLRSNA